MIVIKMGGAEGVNLDAICQDVAGLVGQGQPVVVVHGGSAETNAISTQLGHPPRFVTSTSGFTSRYTDRETLEIFAMVTSGKINTLLVERLQRFGVNAFGLSGIDGRAMLAQRKEAIRIIENGRKIMLRDDYTGKIDPVNADLLHLLLQAGLTPVIAPLAISPEGRCPQCGRRPGGGHGGRGLESRKACPAHQRARLCCASFPDESTLIAHIAAKDLEQALGFAEGRMKKKVLGASEALDLGVGSVIFADGRVEHPVLEALQVKGRNFRLKGSFKFG